MAATAEGARIFRIVLTGGPCGGKTTALTLIHERLTSLGFRVFLVPEAATLMATGGVSLGGISTEQVVLVESNLIRIQIALEDAFHAIAASTRAPSVILCDRGTMDVAAYIHASSWQALLDEQGWTTVGLRDGRYDAVIHLVTAADGAEAFYTTANNAARTESAERARELDRKLREAWLGHPHLRVVDNSSDFSGKVRRVVQAVCRVTGVPEPVEIERKYLVRKAPATLPVPFEEVEIEQTYLLTSDGSEARVRRRGQRGSYTYTHTIKKPLSSGQRVELEHPITGRDFVGFLVERDPARTTIRKRRSCFLWEGWYFELDRFVDPNPGLVVLEIEIEDPEAKIPLPPWLDIDRDVTDDPAYTNFSMSSGKVPPAPGSAP